MYICNFCKQEVEVYDGRVGRQDTCPNCNSFLHICKNCRFWDPNAHNECLETTTAFIRDREAPNFCASFQMKKYDEKPLTSDQDAKAKLDALFK